MKRLLSGVIVLGVMFCVGCQSNNSQSLSPEKSSTKISTIKYCYWDATLETLKDIPEFMWKAQGEYPNEYTEKSLKQIDELRNYRKDSDTIYAFEGWYYDVEYKNQLTANWVDSWVRGDITLYAKIVEREKTNDDVVTASIAYEWDEFGLGKEGIKKIQEGIVLPTEYVEGEEITLPKLKTWKQSDRVSYYFLGWYYDSAFENKIEQETISKNCVGNLIIYPSLEIWVG